MLIGAPIAYLTADLLPGGGRFRETVSDSVLLAFAGLVLVRQLVIWPVLRLVLPHRVLVLGTGPEARLVEASLTSADLPGMVLVGFYALEKAQESVVSPTRVVAHSGPLDETVGNWESTRSSSRCASSAAACCRCGRCSSAGWPACSITDLPRFFERVHGQIPIEALKASWLIYGNGFRQDWLRTIVKRVFDIVVGRSTLARRARCRSCSSRR